MRGLIKRIQKTEYVFCMFVGNFIILGVFSFICVCYLYGSYSIKIGLTFNWLYIFWGEGGEGERLTETGLRK